MNFYAVLGIPRDADEQAIRSAYRILALRFHPDRGAGSSTEKFRQVTEAYETLIDSASRHAHDLSLRWAEHPVHLRDEPMVEWSGPFRREDAAVFGRYERAPHAEFRPSRSVDELLDRWFDDFFFGPEKRKW
jgi:DnaJ-class molecular chaperone